MPLLSRLAAVTIGSLVSYVAGAQAQQFLGHDCQTCHLLPRNAMAITGFFNQTNLGSGPLKVFRVVSGQVAAIGINVTDGHDRYGVALGEPGVAGVGNTNNHLSYRADPTWINQVSYYSTATVTSNQQWTFNLGVNPETPTDLYLLTIQVAGVTNVPGGTASGEWNQLERFYVQVVPPPPPPPELRAPSITAATFSVQVPTSAGFTYYLEYKTALSVTGWSVVGETNGDGTPKVLSDPSAKDPQRFYRVRVQ